MRAPHSLEAEQLVLGAMLLYGDARDDVCSSLVAEDFFSPKHQSVFRALLALAVSGKPLEIPALAVTIQAGGGDADSRFLLGLQAAGSYSWRSSVGVVAECAARRRMIAQSDALRERAYDVSVPFVESMDAWSKATEMIRTPEVEPVVASEIIDLRAGEESAWAIPGVLRRRERVIVTGGEGAGKSHLGRWVAMSIAAGRAPFGGDEIPPLRTLIVDLENEAGDIGDSARRLTKACGYTSGCHAHSRPQGIDLTVERDRRWLAGLLDGEAPALVVIGPLYKMYRGADGRSKASEEAAEIVAETLDDLRVAHDCALWIEAHAPHGESGNRDGGRPRGSSLWLGWPNFGRFMERQRDDRRVVRLRPWRGDRHRQRSWPWGLREAGDVPWAPIWKDGP